MISIKIQHDEIYPEGEWRFIANLKELNEDIDDKIYYYMDDSFDLESIKVGDIIQLDEKFKVLEIEQKEHNKLPDWNTRLEEMTKAISQCSNKELLYLQEQIEKEIRLSNIAISEGFEEC